MPICKGETNDRHLPAMTPTEPSAGAPDPWDWRPGQPCRWSTPVSLIRLEGSDTLRFLHGQTSQDLERARPGQCLSTCCIGPTARLRGLAEVLVDGTGAWLVVTGGDAAGIHQALDRVLFPLDQVTLGAPQPGMLVTVLGLGSTPAIAAGQWQPLEGEPAAGWWLGTAPLQLLLTSASAALPAWLEAIPVLQPLQVERWRLLQGIPAAPGEINEEMNPFELGLAGRVSLSKGCYVGQETLARLATYDGVRQQLRRWSWTEDGASAEVGQALAVGTALTTAAGERAGRITSSLELEPEPGQPRRLVGLALVRRQALEETALLAGAEWARLRLSVPESFVPPPVGAGGS
jgi:folate-binding protein YgfZ